MSKASKPVKIREVTVWIWCDERGVPWVWTASHRRKDCLNEAKYDATLKQCHKFRLVPVEKDSKR